MNIIIGLLGGWRATIFAALSLALLLALGVAQHRYKSAMLALQTQIAADSKALADAEVAARTRELQNAIDQSKIAASYEEAKQNVQAQANGVIADLNNGALRLRDQWRGCEASRVSNAAAAAAELDAIEQSRNASASRIVQAAAACDAQVAGLQALIMSDRRTVNGL